MKHKRFSFRKRQSTSNLNILTRNCSSHKPELCAPVLSWVLWYRDQEIEGVGSQNTIDAKLYDLQKFVDYFYHYNPEGLITDWKKAVTQGFVDQLREEYSSPPSNA